MRDLYKQLGLSASCDDVDILGALKNAGPELREAAEFILLDPHRRAVYDRNRRVLATVGQLRAHLGLTLTRFWPRSRFGDFTPDAAAWQAGARARPVDAQAMAWAFGVEVEGGAASRRRRRRRLTLALLFGLAALLLVALWYGSRTAP